MRTAALRARSGLVWYLKQVSGESRWDEYVDRCRRDGIVPMTRRDFERHRTDHQESHPQSRCC